MGKADVESFIKDLMDEINLFEEKANKLIGLEISAEIFSRILAKRSGSKYPKKPIHDSKITALLNGFVLKIEAFAEREGADGEMLLNLLLEKTIELGRLQGQNPQKFDPLAKMTGQ